MSNNKSNDKNMTLAIQSYELLKSVMKKFIENKKKIPYSLIKDIKKAEKEMIDLANKIGCCRVKYRVKVFDNKEYLIELKRMYKSYNKLEKYVGDKEVGKRPIIITPEKEYSNDIQEEFENLIRHKEKGICFTWHHDSNDWHWVDKKPIYKQFKIYKDLIKKGTIFCKDYNLPTKELCGKKWYGLVINGNDKNYIDIDIGSARLFQYFVNGFVYWFSNEKNRDSMFNWVQPN